MNIGAEIRNLNRDLKSCEDMVTDIPKKKESCRAVHSLGNCGEERRTAFKVTVAGGARGKDYHRQCVPKHQKPATKKSPPRKQAHFQKREHFETESARVDIEIQSEKPLSKADVKCFTAGDEKSTTKPKVKSSWANILKEQNQSEPQCRASSREHCSRERSSSHEENCSRRVKDSAVQCNSPPSREKPAWPSKSFFSSYDPIRTLQFLMDEFKAKAKMKCEPGMGGIISDMDFAIQRLRQDGGSEVPLGRPISSTRDIGLNCNRLFSVAAPSTQLVSDKVVLRFR
ncbi:hypothetical protein AAG570_010911 [Ranatra chinensis]|uniref:Uncharacterized protein n=1 Tax=Ranatra chinensis TaxID=642074 RepID=A0ABD0Z1B3_9HEMI